VKPRLFFLSLGLVALLLAGCAPSAISTTAPAAAAPTNTAPAPVPASETAVPVASEAATEASQQPLPVATSRGPNLEATDPSTVSLASGGLQLVEFFRFT
jgi:hypothetical protein